MKKIAVFGGSFNPPGIHHEEIVKVLSGCGFFERVIVSVSGAYLGKKQEDIASEDRIRLCTVAFGFIPGVLFDFNDLEEEEFTPTINLLEIYSNPVLCYPRLGMSFADTEFYFAVGADLICGSKVGKSEIQTSWDEGERLFRENKFVVFSRKGYEIDIFDLPPHYFDCTSQKILEGSSTNIRNRLKQNLSIHGLVSEGVERLILKNNLYRK